VPIIENKELVRRFIEEVVNTGDVGAMAEYVSADCVETDGKLRVVSGIEGMQQHVLGVRATYADLHLTIERQIAEGEWVVTQITARGMHTGEWLGIAPTGRPVVITGVNVDRIVNGRIVEHGGAANMLDALLEIDAVRPVTER
jgi:predicted ester cyclase